jgi:photosystem II stability/assembly factor-like uncharacterized protein
MNKRLLFTAIFIVVSLVPLAQNGWKVCTAPQFSSRVDDIFIINGKTGYAVCGDGQIVKSIDSGNTWTTIFRDTNTYFRSVEFINEKKGFAGGFPIKGVYKNIFLKTMDGGNTWTDLTENLDPIARDGICGLSVADTNTIYGCGNWYSHAYIIKSTDGGNNWQLINMVPYASSLIDMYFINKDTGFVTGKSPGGDTVNTAVILYTTDGGITWTTKFKNKDLNEYCWKIQRLTDQIYFASIEDLNLVYPSILKSYDGGMSWTKYYVCDSFYNIEGLGFIDPLKGFTGGGAGGSFESDDGGKTWNYSSVCPYMDRVFRVNDSVIFATGFQIWKYEKGKNGNNGPVNNPAIINLYCYPNPVSKVLTINFALARSTRAVLNIYDAQGKAVKYIVNEDKPAGDYQYLINTDNLIRGMYFVLLKTHEDKLGVKVLVSH